MTTETDWPLGLFGEEVPRPRFLDHENLNVDPDSLSKFSGALNDWIFSNTWIMSPVQHETEERKAWAFESHDKTREKKRRAAEDALGSIEATSKPVFEEMKQLLDEFLSWEAQLYKTMKTIGSGFELTDDPVSPFWERNAEFNTILLGYLRAHETLMTNRKKRSEQDVDPNA